MDRESIILKLRSGLEHVINNLSFAFTHAVTCGRVEMSGMLSLSTQVISVKGPLEHALAQIAITIVPLPPLRYMTLPGEHTSYHG